MTAAECRPRLGKPYPCENRGKRLGEFSFLDSDERFLLDYVKRESEKAVLRARYSGTLAEKLYRKTRLWEHVGLLPVDKIIQYLLDDLTEAGVELSDKKLAELVKRFMELHNYSHHWCQNGWAPVELQRTMMKKGAFRPAVSFGPNIQKAFADGTMDKEELIRMLKDRHIDLIE